MSQFDRAGRDASPSIRPVLIVALVAVVAVGLLAVGVVVAWSNFGDDEPDRDGPLVTVATFTPAPPDFTPEVARTFAAEQTAAVQTATAQPTGTPVPTGAVDPNPESCFEENPEVEIRPPDVFLVTESGRRCGNAGAYNWADLELGQGAEIQPERGVSVPPAGLQSSAGTEISLEPGDSPYPFRSVVVSFYDYDDNIAIPQNEQGQIISQTPVFVPREDPVWSTTVEGGDVSFTPELPPGRYLLATRVNWDAPAEVESFNGPLFTAYLYEVTVN